jgi:hypothetical protein
MELLTENTKKRFVINNYGYTIENNVIRSVWCATSLRLFEFYARPTLIKYDNEDNSVDIIMPDRNRFSFYIINEVCLIIAQEFFTLLSYIDVQLSDKRIEEIKSQYFNNQPYKEIISLRFKNKISCEKDLG